MIPKVAISFVFSVILLESHTGALTSTTLDAALLCRGAVNTPALNCAQAAKLALIKDKSILNIPKDHFKRRIRARTAIFFSWPVDTNVGGGHG